MRSASLRSSSPFLAGLLVVMAGALPALAACPIELATYSDSRGGGEINFTPTMEGATASNSFRLLLDNDVVLDGMVQWLDHEPRPWGTLTYKCPDGDVTGDLTGIELDACTMWEGVIYTSDDKGNIGLLPERGHPAPKTLVFPALGPSLLLSAAHGENGFTKTPWDVFTLNGCQE